MKKIIAIVFAAFAFVALASAQPRALGVRAGWGGEISYQHNLGGENFLEVDAGWTANAINFAAAYDFQIAPVGPFGFYAGPAADLWLVNEGGIGLGVGAQVGLEYVFDAIPLQISLDWRPMFNIIPATAFGWQGVGLGIRYMF